MKGSPRVIAQLQKQLRLEIAARDQYLAHALQYEDWGLTRLYQRIYHEMEEEATHASALIRRILFLEGPTPNLADREEMRIGADVPAMLRNDLQTEYDTAERLRESIAVCEEEQDYQTREVLLVLLKDTEEDHAYWLEQQLDLIERMGLANYLQSMAEDGAPPA
jgi:bacterioferritin